LKEDYVSFNYNIAEVFDIGIEIEKNGRDFYTTAAETAENEDLKTFFSELSNWENAHISIFSQFKANLPKELTEESPFYDAENEKAKYLKAAADTHVFNKTLDIPAIVKGCKTVTDILNLAIQFEKDSVVLFNTMTWFVPENLGRENIKKLIDEELMHIAYLQEKITLINNEDQ
jgi:rubrerythrin